MAHAAKYKQSDTVALAIHYERRAGCELSNRDIDHTRTYMNYNLAQELQPLRTEQFVKQRLSEIHHLKRKDIIVMVDWIVTLPKNVPNEDEGKFFKLTYQFLEEKYGKKNVIAAWVHKDEKTPHIHFSFLPVIKEDNKEKLNCKKVITRQELKEFHPSLGQYLEQHLGYLPEIQNDATVNGNRTIKELKAKDDLNFYHVYQNVNNHLQASKDVISKANEISFENSSFIDKSKTIKKCNQVIDQLKYSNKILESDTIELRNLVHVQKREIDSYRDMPLVKQIDQKKYVIDKQSDEIDSLERKINLYKYDIDQLNKSKNKLKKKV